MVKRVSLTWKRLMRHPGWLVGAIFLGDIVLTRVKPGLVIFGAIDETAHIATMLLAGGSNPERHHELTVAGAFVGSILIDVDHVPLVLLKRPMESAADRPVSHSLPTLLMLAAIARSTTGGPRALFLGLTAGTASHFLRDLATGGAPLTWPLSRRLISVPYAAYALLLTTLAIRASVVNRAADVNVSRSCDEVGNRRQISARTTACYCLPHHRAHGD